MRNLELLGIMMDQNRWSTCTAMPLRIIRIGRAAPPHKAARLPKMISTLSNHVENLNWTRVKRNDCIEMVIQYNIF